MPLPDINDRIDKLEGDIYGQEHRWPVILNRFFSKEEYASKSPDGQAGIRSAFWWSVVSLFLPFFQSSSTAGVGIVAILTLLLAWHANYIASEANAIAERQARLLEQEVALANATRESAIHTARTDRVEQLLAKNDPNAIGLEDEFIQLTKTIAPYELPGLGKVSPERGRLLIAVVDSPRGSLISKADFSFADARNASFTSKSPHLVDAFLESARLDGANLANANMQEAFLNSANLTGTLLYGANLQSADLTGSILVNANLQGADLRHAILNGANMEGCNLEGAIVHVEDWLTNTLGPRSKVKGLNRQKWQVLTGTTPGQFVVTIK